VTDHPTRPENASDRSMLAGRDDDPVSVAAARDIKEFFAEDGKRGLLYTHYSHNMPLHTTDGTTYGRDAVIAATQRALAAYPDIRLFGDDVVWAQHGDSYHTSHRITHAGSNLGWSQYGPPTSKKMKRRALAHCVVHENRVVEEWLARDELAVVRSLGLDEFVVAGEIGPLSRSKKHQMVCRRQSTWSGQCSNRCGTGGSSTGSPITTAQLQ